MTAALIDERRCGSVARARDGGGPRPRRQPRHRSCLAVVLVGEDECDLYRRQSALRRRCRPKPRSTDHRLPGSVSEADLLAFIAGSARPGRARHSRSASAGAADRSTRDYRGDRSRQRRRRISPAAMHAAGLRRAGEGRACVARRLGRSTIVGKPLAQLLIAESATVTVAHSKKGRRCRGGPTWCLPRSVVPNSSAVIGSSRAPP
jgi:methylenetetrahydrofolate dehydrogenase (NADP+) / methenyltetrahydrofolate cyclohydrolase